jgi:predicted ATP-dependent endonuclease of OLD family
MVVGIFEAFRQLGGHFGTVIIEEPEMYLHPQAQRYFHRLLCEMSEKHQCQVIYSTHSPIFADVNRFESLRLVRRQSGQHSRVTFVSQESVRGLRRSRAKFKLGGKFDSARNEVLFASQALLVEGYGDRVAALMLAEKLDFHPDAEGVVVVDCGGKSGIELVIRVCNALEIPYLVVHDEDLWPLDNITDGERQRRLAHENKEEEEKNRKLSEAVGDKGILFVIKPSLEAILGINRDARDKPRRIAEALESITIANLPGGLTPLLRAVRILKRGVQA